MEGYGGDLWPPYPELVRLNEAGHAMVIDLSGSHRLGYPGLWISAQGNP